MTRLIKQDETSSGFLFSKNGNISFNNAYTPAINFQSSKSYDNIIQGKIYLRNCALVLDTVNSTFEQLKI